MSMTTNQPSVIDDDAFSVRRTIRIAATPAKVWSAITEPALISQWFGRADFASTDVGALGTLTWDDHGSFPVRIEEVDEQRMITYLWNHEPSSKLDDSASTVCTFTLEPVDGGTQLTVVETGFENTPDPAAGLEDHRGGWNSELDELVALLEGSA